MLDGYCPVLINLNGTGDVVMFLVDSRTGSVAGWTVYRFGICAHGLPSLSLSAGLPTP